MSVRGNLGLFKLSKFKRKKGEIYVQFVTFFVLAFIRDNFIRTLRDPLRAKTANGIEFKYFLNKITLPVRDSSVYPVSLNFMI